MSVTSNGKAKTLALRRQARPLRSRSERPRCRGLNMDRQSTSVADTITSTPSSSPLSCPICAPHLSAEDADFLYYPSDEEIPVSLCKYVYGYPRDIDSEYQTLEELGKGSFGVVSRVVSKETGEFYACKTITKSRPTWTGGMDGGMREATTSTYLLKIQAEVNFLARLSDVPEVVGLKKAFEDDSHVHLVMDLCEGGSLQEKMERRRAKGEASAASFTETQVKSIMRCIINVLLNCHERGIMYRDIKPQNFLYVDAEASDDALRVVDFGLAMPYIPGDEGLMLTKRAGTPAYMAPELVLRRYNEKVDLWSAGMLMYQLLASRFPFWGGEISPRMALDDIFFDVMIRDLDFDVIADSASPEAADLCKKLLTRDPLNRVSAMEAAQHPWLRD